MHEKAGAGGWMARGRSMSAQPGSRRGFAAFELDHIHPQSLASASEAFDFPEMDFGAA
jgi:hypothetical protein